MRIHYYAFLSPNQKKYGTRDQQLEAIAGDISVAVKDLAEIRAEDFPSVARTSSVVVAVHAGVFGFFRNGQSRRHKAMKTLARGEGSAMEGGAAIKIVGGDAVVYDTPEKWAGFDEMAARPVKGGDDKPKRSAGRPKKYQKPTGEDLEYALALYAGPLHVDDVGWLIGWKMKCPPIKRQTLAEWFGPRPKWTDENGKGRKRVRIHAPDPKKNTKEHGDG